MSEDMVQETAAEETEIVDEQPAFVVNTDTAINASLDEIEDPDTLKKMVKKLRGENAKTRTEKQASAKELAEFKAWKESQMSELERAQARIAELESTATSAAREAVLAKYGLINEDGEEDELAEFVTGSREEMEQRAAKLAKRRKAEGDSSGGGGFVPDQFKHSSPRPVKTEKDPGAAFLEFLSETGKFTS